MDWCDYEHIVENNPIDQAGGGGSLSRNESGVGRITLVLESHFKPSTPLRMAFG